MYLIFAEVVPRTPRCAEMIRRSKFYEGLSEEELKVEGLVTSESLREYGLLASFQNIEPVSGRGQTQVSADIREQIALELSKVSPKPLGTKILYLLVGRRGSPTPSRRERRSRLATPRLTLTKGLRGLVPPGEVRLVFD